VFFWRPNRWREISGGADWLGERNRVPTVSIFRGDFQCLERRALAASSRLSSRHDNVYNSPTKYTLDIAMRTNIEIDDELIRAAMGATGLKTKRAVVEEGLRLLIKLKRQEEVKALFGQVRWEGDLDESRLGRMPSK
jgi:Arc/MetJ family transcription regulator